MSENTLLTFSLDNDTNTKVYFLLLFILYLYVQSTHNLVHYIGKPIKPNHRSQVYWLLVTLFN